MTPRPGASVRIADAAHPLYRGKVGVARYPTAISKRWRVDFPDVALGFGRTAIGWFDAETELEAIEEAACVTR